MAQIAGRWAIGHRTRYHYSTPVAFAPHLLRLIPRSDGARCLEQALRITPAPLATTEFDDVFGNRICRVTFGAGYFDELTIDSRLLVEVLPRGLLGGVLAPPPLPWPVPVVDALFAHRQPDGSPEVVELAQRLSSRVGHAPLPFFELLCQTLYSTLDRGARVDGAAQAPAHTLAIGRGACRDLTVLFLAACRTLGVAGRFVSGYQCQEGRAQGQLHLHAWPEVFVPELGWLGWDPTLGVAAGTGHIALSAAPEQSATMPVEGGFYFDGSAVTSTLEYEIAFESD